MIANRTLAGQFKRRSPWPAALAIVTLCFACGCSKSPYELAEVRGKVTIDGKPLAKAKVMFAPTSGSAGQGVNSGKPAFGTLQDDGGFVLSTYGTDDGAVVGTHAVTIIALADDTAAPAAPAIVPKFSRLNVPRQYKVEGDKENQIAIELTQQEVTKYGQK